MITLEAKSQHLKLKIEVTADGVTKQIFASPRYALAKRLEAVCVGLRSELLMFLVEVEKDLDLE